MKIIIYSLFFNTFILTININCINNENNSRRMDNIKEEEDKKNNYQLKKIENNNIQLVQAGKNSVKNFNFDIIDKKSFFKRSFTIKLNVGSEKSLYEAIEFSEDYELTESLKLDLKNKFDVLMKNIQEQRLDKINNNIIEIEKSKDENNQSIIKIYSTNNFGNEIVYGDRNSKDIESCVKTYLGFDLLTDIEKKLIKEKTKEQVNQFMISGMALTVAAAWIFKEQIYGYFKEKIENYKKNRKFRSIRKN